MGKYYCKGCNQIINRPTTKFYEYCETANKLIRIKKVTNEEIEKVRRRV